MERRALERTRFVTGLHILHLSRAPSRDPFSKAIQFVKVVYGSNANQFEAGVSQPRRATGEVIRRAFEQAGVLFIDGDGGGPGVRLGT